MKIINGRDEKVIKKRIGIGAVIYMCIAIFVLGCAKEKTASVHEEKYKSAVNVL
ncbi:MAG: hypothetical protein U9Q24_03380 [Candidatus Ratteibacteria bacterium]|nr:hypothetical protein [Candidatus Ratteibacteria bacterium]